MTKLYVVVVMTKEREAKAKKPISMMRYGYMWSPKEKAEAEKFAKELETQGKYNNETITRVMVAPV